MADIRAVRTTRRRHGDAAEALVARQLSALGWSVLGRNLRVARDEIDLIAVDPGPPRTLVFVEVRSNGSNRFGAPEESLVGPKMRRTYRAAWRLLRAGAEATRFEPPTPGRSRDPGQPPAAAGQSCGAGLPRLPWRVDVVVVERAPQIGPDAGGATIRHLRNVGIE